MLFANSKLFLHWFFIFAISFSALLVGCAETVAIRTAPPPLPYYDQPYCPGPGYIWVPGYWAYGQDGYYWVPGIWEYAPHAGWLWTPGYWGWSDGEYVWHQGYWARDIGFYGGIDYGYGYSGDGYAGGYWRGSDFYYNSSVTNVNVAVVSNTYQAPSLAKKASSNPVSYNGGNGGTASTPTTQQLAVARQPHIAPTPLQRSHMLAAGTNRELLASQNHGIPGTELVAKRLSPVSAKTPKPVPKPKVKKKPLVPKEEQPKRVEDVK